MARAEALAQFRVWFSGSAANAGDGADGWFLGSDRNFAPQRSEAPERRAAGSGNLRSDPENARVSLRSALPESLLVNCSWRSDAFRCRSIAAAGDSLVSCFAKRK